MKGFVDVPGRDRRQIVQAVGDRVQHYFDRPWEPGETRATRLVVIGKKGLDRAAIAAALAGLTMHLLATEPGTIADGSAAVDLAQTPGDIVVLASADTEIALLAAAQKSRRATDPEAPSLRLAPILRLGHNLSVDLYMEVAAKAKLVVARLLGGSGYWPYGIERLVETCRASGIPLALLPGDDKPDPELAERSTLPPEASRRLWRYLAEGGPANADNFLRYAASLIGHETEWAEPSPLLRAGLYWRDKPLPSLADIEAEWRGDGGIVPIVFYRALVQSGNTAPVDALVTALAARQAAAAADLCPQPQGRRSHGADRRMLRRTPARGHSQHHRVLGRCVRGRRPAARGLPDPAGGVLRRRRRWLARRHAGAGPARSGDERGAARDRRTSADPRGVVQGAAWAATPRPRPIWLDTNRSPTASPLSPSSRATGRGSRRSRRPSGGSRSSWPTTRTRTGASATGSGSTPRPRRWRSSRH